MPLTPNSAVEPIQQLLKSINKVINQQFVNLIFVDQNSAEQCQSELFKAEIFSVLNSSKPREITKENKTWFITLVKDEYNSLMDDKDAFDKLNLVSSEDNNIKDSKRESSDHQPNDDESIALSSIKKIEQNLPFPIKNIKNSDKNLLSFELGKNLLRMNMTLVIQDKNKAKKLYSDVKNACDKLSIKEIPTFEQLLQINSKESMFGLMKVLSNVMEQLDGNVLSLFKIGMAFADFHMKSMLMFVALMRSQNEEYQEGKKNSLDIIYAIEENLLLRNVNQELINSFLKLAIEFINNTTFDINNEGHKIEKVLTILEIKLKEVLKLDSGFEEKKVAQVKQSMIDKTRPITDEWFVLSLVRKPEGVHAEHAFLIIEGKENDEFHTWFIDFVGNPILPGIGNGKIRIHHYKGGLDEELLYRCDKKMMDIRKGDRILHSSWHISKEDVYNLITVVEKSKEHPPKFNILGYRSWLAVGTGLSSSVPTGHNCFTWAKEQIRNLNNPNITLPEDDIASWVFSATSRVLIDPQYRATMWYQKPIVLAGIVGTTAVVSGLIGANLDKISDCKIV